MGQESSLGGSHHRVGWLSNTTRKEKKETGRKRLGWGAFLNQNPIRLGKWFLAENGMSFIANALGNISYGISVIKNDRQDLTRFHAL